MREAKGKAQYIFDVLAFLVGIGLAWAFRWETTDLLWSLWLSSLLTGYLTLLGTLAPFVFIGLLALIDPKGTGSQKAKYVFIVLGALFLFVAFFSLHFGGFHAVHALFLNILFPLGHDIEVPFSFWPPTILRFAWELVPLYSYFLIAVVLSQRDRLILMPLQNIRAMWEAYREHDRKSEQELDVKGIVNDDHALSRPYRNIIRMQLLVFFLALIHFLKLDSFIVFAIVYAVYFFPWSIFAKDTEQAQLTTSDKLIDRPIYEFPSMSDEEGRD